MKKNKYSIPQMEAFPLEYASVLCDSNVDGDISVTYDNPFGDSEISIP